MLTEPFYHGTIRKYIVAFGTIFNNIRIRRFLEDGSVRQNIPIPLTFSPKQRWWTRLRTDAILGDNAGDVYSVSRNIPNSAFNIVSMTYDAERKLNTLQKTVPIKKDRESEAKWQYQRVPYNFGFELYTVFKQYDDSLQYIEQVLPYFTPFFNIPTIDIPELNILNDSTLTLGSIQPEIIYEGGSDADSRTIMYTFSFTLKGYIYPPTKEGDVVEKVITNIFAWPQGKNIDELGTTDESDSFGFRSITHIPELTISNIEGIFRPHENIFVGSSLKYHNKLGTFISIDGNIMQIVTGNKFEKGDIIRGSISGASATVEDFNIEVERSHEYRRN